MKTNETAPQWEPPKEEPTGLTPEDLAAWRDTTARLRAVAVAEGLSQSEVARRSGVSIGTISPWVKGSYAGSISNVTERVRRWLEAHEEAKRAMMTLPTAPDYVPTPTSQRLVEALLYAQTMPEFSVATMGAGVGKTTTARHYVATRPHAYLVTMRPSTAGRHAMLQELALALDVMERNPARLDRAIGGKLKRNGRHTLLILDEAQNLVDDAVNQLRYLNDEFGCGIALLGNEAVYRRFGSLSHDDKQRDGDAQVQSRIGLRILQRQARAGDVDAILDAWKIDDAEVRRLCHAIARKPGALRQVDKALKLASMLAMGAGEQLGASHLRTAWTNRSGEELRS